MTLEQAWWAHLAGVRWFGGKGATGSITTVEPVRDYARPEIGPRLSSEIATIDYADGRREFYHLLVARYRSGTAPVPVLGTIGGFDVVDATTDPAALQAFVAALLDEGAFSDARVLGAVPPESVAVWPGEQSNTTLTLGTGALLKLFRRVEPGANLESEILTALDGRGAAVPAVYGRLTAPWPAGTLTDLGIALERIPAARDGWQLAVAACAAEDSFAGPARALGRALATIHAQLLAVFGGSTAAGDDLADTMLDRLDAAVATAGVLAPYRAALTGRFEALRDHRLPVQRIHGDFHLGQTLYSAAGWTIIDFEGEPAKSAAERRAPDSVWRDVAGMLRSLDYARSAHAEPASAAARTWAEEARGAFLQGYCEGREIPADVLSSYEVDKAIYEVVYEIRNRPAWVGIPLGAVAEFIGDETSSTHRD